MAKAKAAVVEAEEPRVDPQADYPKWIKGPLGPMEVGSAAEEDGVLNGDLIVVAVNSAQGTRYVVEGKA